MTRFGVARLTLATVALLLSCSHERETKVGATFQTPSWNVPAWYIDSAAGADTNGCTSQGNACQTCGEIVRRWGSTHPQLAQSTTITWLNDAPASDQCAIDPQLMSPNGAISLLGTPTLVGSGTFAAVTPKNLVAKQLLNADLGQAPGAFVGLELYNVTRGAWAWIDSVVSGNVVVLTQPFVPAFTPPNGGWTLFPAMNDAFAPGDTYQIWRPTQVKLVEYRPTYYATSVAIGRVNMANLWVTDAENTGINLGQFYFNTGIGVFTQSRFDTNLIPQVVQPTDSGCLVNVLGRGGLNQTNTGGGMGIIGGSYNGRGATGVILNTADVDGGVIFHGDVSIFQSANIGTTYLDGGFFVLQQSAVVQVKPTFYSTGTLVSVNATVILSPQATIMFLAPATTAFSLPATPFKIIGPNFIDGATTASAYDTGSDPAVWHGGRQVTPALLDTLISGGGFKLAAGHEAALFVAQGATIASL